MGKKKLKQENVLGNNEIERFLNKSADDFTRNDLVKFVRAKDIKLITLAPITGDGRLKNLSFAVAEDKQLHDTLERGGRVDGSSHFPELRAERSDIYIIPRYSTAFVNPFSEIPTLVVLCACYNPEEELFDLCPYRLVKTGRKSLEESTGYNIRIMGELEFYLIGNDSIPGAMQSNIYQASTPFVRFQHVRDEITVTLSNMGVPVKYAHAEVGGLSSENVFKEQHEVELELDDPVKTADNLVKSKWVIRNVAVKYGLIATFAPKIDTDLAGNGMHFHFQVLKGEKNILFKKSNNQISNIGHQVIGGLVKCASSLTAFGNTVPTSYLRFAPGQEAPTAPTWGKGNRSALIRIPLAWVGTGSMATELNPKSKSLGRVYSDARTFELRSPDGSANVHQTIAGIIVAALTGINDADSDKIAQEYQAPPGKAVSLEKKQADKSKKKQKIGSLPRSCWDSASELERMRHIYEEGNVFPPGCIETVLAKLRGYKDKQLASVLKKSKTKLKELVDLFLYCG